jgi:hypothetical protein
VLAATSGSDIALNKKVLAANEILKVYPAGGIAVGGPSSRIRCGSGGNPAARILPSRESRFPKSIRLFMEKFSSAVFTGTNNGKSPWGYPHPSR